MNKIRKQIEDNIADSYDYPNTVDLLEESFKKNSVLFSLFCAENYMPKRVLNHPIFWEGSMNRRYTTEELYKLFENGLD